MHLILLGPPGAGKGTQSQILRDTFGLAQISTGDMLRQAVSRGDEIGHEVHQVMESGALVSDEIINRLVRQRVLQPDCSNGFIFDGFPRTVEQARSMLDSGIGIDYVIEIELADELTVKRLSGRRTHPASGRVYHLEYNPPKVADQDDLTGEPLIQRPDDDENTIRERLKVYHNQTRPLVTFFRDLQPIGDIRPPAYHRINGSQSVEKICQDLTEILKLH